MSVVVHGRCFPLLRSATGIRALTSNQCPPVPISIEATSEAFTVLLDTAAVIVCSSGSCAIQYWQCSDVICLYRIFIRDRPASHCVSLLATCQPAMDFLTTAGDPNSMEDVRGSMVVLWLIDIFGLV